MKINFTDKKKLVMTLCLVAAALVAVAGGTFAVYTSQVFQRSVVRNRYNDEIRFSSDKLYQETWAESIENPRKFYYPMGENQKTMTFHVCNYDQVKSTLLNEQDISYTITFHVRDGKENATYTVTTEDGTVIDLKADQTGEASKTTNVFTLKGNKRSVHSYTFAFTEADDPCKLTVVVKPTEPTLTQNKMLCATLIPAKYASVTDFAIHWEFPDSNRTITDGNGTSKAVKPSDFSAYNVFISVVAGTSGDVRISWNPNVLEIDKFYKPGQNSVPVTVDGMQWSCITIPMSAMDETVNQQIIFYNSNNTVDPNWTWDQLPVKVEAVTAN